MYLAKLQRETVLQDAYMHAVHDMFTFCLATHPLICSLLPASCGAIPEVYSLSADSPL